MSKRGYFWLQTAFAALAWCAVAFLVLAFWIAANGCQGRSAASAASARPSDLPAAVKAQGQAATDVREATNDIQNSAAKIEVAAPEVATDVSAIFVGVKKLRTAWESMMAIKATLEGEVKASTKLAKDLAAANKRIAELEAKESGFLSKLLAGAAAAGLLVAVLSFAWLRNATGVLVGVSVFAACVVGQWIIAYRLWIAIGGITAALIYLAWTTFAERLVGSELVKTVELAKGHVPNYKTTFNVVQSWLTRRTVDKIKASKPAK